MRVLSVNKYFQHTGGGDRFFFDSMEILSRNGHDVIPFCLDYPGNLETPYKSYFPRGVGGDEVESVSGINKARLFLDGIYSFNARSALRRLVRDCRPDVAHLHILHYSLSPSIIDELHAQNVPVVFSLHDYRVGCVGGYVFRSGQSCQLCAKRKYYNAVIHRCYRDSTLASLMGAMGNYVAAIRNIYGKVGAFTVPHEGMRQIVAAFGIPLEKVRILRNPLLSAERNNAGHPISLKDYVLFFGNISAPKGVMTLMGAAELLPQIPFVFCGKGPALETLKKAIVSRKIRNVVVDSETRWNSGLQRLIEDSRFVVSPSEWPTPLEYVTLEAMLFGKAVVASDIDGNRSVIADGETGVLFKAGDSTALAKRIERMYNDRNYCRQIGTRAREFIEREFDPQIFCRDLVEVFEFAMSR